MKTSQNRLSTSFLTVTAIAIAAVIVTPAVAQDRSAAAQARAERAAERRAAAEQRLQALQQNRADRVMRRTDVFERAATASPEQVAERLSVAEMNVLEAWSEIDPAGVAAAANDIGDAALKKAANAKGVVLTEDQIDAIVAAAARAATISEDEVSEMLAAGTVKIEDLFDTTDPEKIAATLNGIGQDALDLQADAKELREAIKDARPKR